MKQTATVLFIMAWFSLFGEIGDVPNPETSRKLNDWLWTWSNTNDAKMQSEAVRRQRMIIFSLDDYYYYDSYLIDKVREQAKKYKRI